MDLKLPTTFSVVFLALLLLFPILVNAQTPAIPPNMTAEEFEKIVKRANKGEITEQFPQYRRRWAEEEPGWRTCMWYFQGDTSCNDPMFDEPCEVCYSKDYQSNCYLYPAPAGKESDKCQGLNPSDCCEVTKDYYLKHDIWGAREMYYRCYCKIPTPTCPDGHEPGYKKCMDVAWTTINGKEVVAEGVFECSDQGTYEYRGICSEGGCENGRGCFDICPTCDQNQVCKFTDTIGVSYCKDCHPRTQKDCYNGNAYWFDSCGRKESVAEYCSGYEECVSGECRITAKPKRPERPGIWGVLSDVWSDFVNWLRSLFKFSQTTLHQEHVAKEYRRGTRVNASVVLDTSGLSKPDTDHTDGDLYYLSKCYARLPVGLKDLDRAVDRNCVDLTSEMNGKMTYSFTLDKESDVYFFLTEQKGTYSWETGTWSWDTDILRKRSKIMEYRIKEAKPPAKRPGIWDTISKIWNDFINWIKGLFG
ncbi:hypothetical protein AKJ58_00110 [candidate division MSBL1 archaeon SCGC-AAA385D11]|uniref:Uncharacterized protein n=1 Tax=candidate division MSBL1 archaeon SCGC-AAA385D11 TaxID=1698286 RepID=A0A133VPG8_9EURY|nr:hypothetical protein AKJ58_00110 [candidate division MSBL1 archaeon SCGC-AAA385D11]